MFLSKFISDSGVFHFFPLEKADVHYAATLESEYFTFPESEESMLKTLDSPSALNYIAFVGRKRCGYITSYLTPFDEAEILSFAVEIKYRARGVGTMILKNYIKECMKLGIETVMLEVRETNLKAQHMYEKLGFVHVGWRKGYYSDPKENAKLYNLELADVDPKILEIENPRVTV